MHRDEIFPALGVSEEDGYIGKSDYKFNQMVALDETFTIVGIKKEARKAKKTQAKSQCVGDYVEMLPVLEEQLQAFSKAYEFFASLTPGYKRGWARYVYSAKQEATQKKRLEETVRLLEQDVKSKT